MFDLALAVTQAFAGCDVQKATPDSLIVNWHGLNLGFTYDAYCYDLGVSIIIGKSKKNYDIASIFEMFFAEDELPRYTYISDTKTGIAYLATIASSIQARKELILSHELTIEDDWMKFSEVYAEAQKRLRIRDQAEKLWVKKDYSGVVSLYEGCKFSLSPLEYKRLEHAKKHL